MLNILVIMQFQLSIPVGKSLSRGSVRSTGMKSFSQYIVGSGLPVALHSITVFLSFSTAFSVGVSEIRGYPLGTATNSIYVNLLQITLYHKYKCQYL